MDTTGFENSYEVAVINKDILAKIRKQENGNLISVHWELKIIFYLGVSLLTTGLGIMVYKNIDTIGHQAIVAFIALLSASSFFYCYKTKAPFSFQKVEAPNQIFDYALLLGCLSFVSLIAYLQFEYTLFGNRFGLASFIPLLVLFFSAYYFDHLGILSLAITNLAAWAGITVTPTRILKDNDFNSDSIIYTGILLGILLVVASIASKKLKVKAHFEFTYSNFGTHVLFISCLAAMFNFEKTYLLWFLLLLGICAFYYIKALSEKSFYYMLLLTFYGYIGLSYVVIRLMFSLGDDIGSIYLAFLYFIASALGMIAFLISMNKKLKSS